MRALGVVLIVSGLAGCTGGRSLQGDGGPPADGRPPADGGGEVVAPPCGALGACGCVQASVRCAPIATACWCPSDVCALGGACICGGGSFLACQPASCPPASCGIGALGEADGAGCRACEAAPACATAVARVVAACGGQPYVATFASTACSGSNPTCVAACLANLGSCGEINCSFCQACDCAGPATALSTCIAACGGP